MREALDKQLQTKLPPSAKKLLISLDKHWDGLTVFVDEPQIPMDNNSAERGLRTGVLGRKSYYGSGAVWSSALAAMLFSVFGTVKLSGLNTHTWLLAYSEECMRQGGEPPKSIEQFLPWNMTEKQKQLLSQPPMYEDSS